MVGIFRQIELLVGGHPAVRIDVGDAPRHDLHLGLADGGVEGDELTVQIGETDHIIVNKVDRAHAAPGQRLGAVAAHAADTEHGYPSAVECFDGFRSYLKAKTGKLVCHGAKNLLSVINVFSIITRAWPSAQLYAA